MHCVEPVLPGRGTLACCAIACALLTACGSSAPPPPPPAPVAAPAPVPAPSKPDLPPAAKPPEGPLLPPAPAVRSRAELELQAARRIAAASPAQVYLGKPPDILLAVPVLQVELHADGRVKRISVLRYPGQARDTVDLAIQAVHRAAPYGNVQRMPEPWMFIETFLFNDQRRFKPRGLE